MRSSGRCTPAAASGAGCRRSQTDVLVLDDWGVSALDASMRADLLEIIDDRAAHKATIITTQLPIDHWHGWIGDATVADAILDRLMQRMQRINLSGESMRRPACEGPKTGRMTPCNHVIVTAHPTIRSYAVPHRADRSRSPDSAVTIAGIRTILSSFPRWGSSASRRMHESLRERPPSSLAPEAAWQSAASDPPAPALPSRWRSCGAACFFHRTAELGAGFVVVRKREVPSPPGPVMPRASHSKVWPSEPR